MITIYDLPQTIIDSQLPMLTLCPKSPVFKLRFHNSDSKPSKASNNNGLCLYTLPLSKVSAKAVSRPHATANPSIFTISRFCCLRTFGSSATRAYRHRCVPVITVDSGSRQDLRVCGWGGSYYVRIQDHLRGDRVFGGVWNALN